MANEKKSALKIPDPQFRYSVFSDVLTASLSHLEEEESQLSFGQIYGSFISAQQKIEDLPYVIFDFETTGLNFQFDRIVEVGGVKIRKGEVLGQFEQLVKPDVPMKKEAERITGIRSQDLKNAPPIQKVLPEFLNFAKGSVLVAHNASFDMGMLNAACKRLNYHVFFKAICTLKVSRTFLKLPNHKLDSLAKYFQLHFESRHRSLGDVLVTKDIWESFMKQHLQNKTFADLAPFTIDFAN